MTFLLLHSTLFTWAPSTWLRSSTGSLWAAPAPNRSRQIHFLNISSHSRPFVSADTTCEVDFTLSAWIFSPHIQMFTAPPAGRARSLPWNAHLHRPFRWWSEPPFVIICQSVAPLERLIQSSGHCRSQGGGLWLICSRQTLQRRIHHTNMFARWPDLSVRM